MGLIASLRFYARLWLAVRLVILGTALLTLGASLMDDAYRGVKGVSDAI